MASAFRGVFEGEENGGHGASVLHGERGVLGGTAAGLLLIAMVKSVAYDTPSMAVLVGKCGDGRIWMEVVGATVCGAMNWVKWETTGACLGTCLAVLVAVICGEEFYIKWILEGVETEEELRTSLLIDDSIIG